MTLDIKKFTAERPRLPEIQKLLIDSQFILDPFINQ